MTILDKYGQFTYLSLFLSSGVITLQIHNIDIQLQHQLQSLILLSSIFRVSFKDAFVFTSKKACVQKMLRNDSMDGSTLFLLVLAVALPCPQIANRIYFVPHSQYALISTQVDTKRPMVRFGTRNSRAGFTTKHELHTRDARSYRRNQMHCTGSHFKAVSLFPERIRMPHVSPLVVVCCTS